MVQKTGYEKLKNLRELIENLPSYDQKKFQAYIITSDDAHHSEYIQEQDKRREYISGFKGSAGTVVVTLNHALLWTDGRYFVQAKLELDPADSWTLMKEGLPEIPSIEEWLIENLPPNSLIGTDPNLITISDWLRIDNSLKTAGLSLFPVEKNLVDIVWGLEKLPPLRNKIVPHEIIYSGKTAGDKVNECFEKMKKKGVSILILTALDDVAYLLNLRGSDIPYNPVFLAYAILFSNKVHLFVDEDKLSEKAKEQMQNEKVDFVCHPYETVRQYLGEILHTCKSKVWLSHTANHALHILCSSAEKYVSITPVTLMKLVKNEIEIEGMKQAHIWDAVALVKYFSWIEENISEHRITEISGAEQLEIFRHEEEKYIGPSFPTISGFGTHGAIIHYQPSVKTDIAMNSQELYLCDAGAHFSCGTTDVTRTLHFGQPTSYERECFTRVLKGQLQLAMSKFPAKIKGNYLDTLARKYLWDVGLDYLHGTGHGVGAYLNVHEFPAMISWKPYPDDPGLQAGMFLSNEPGYYEDGNFGIRLENIELVVNATTKYQQPNRKFLTFETVTLVPIQTKMIDTTMLTNEEIQFLNNYHKKCYEILQPHLQDPRHITALKWLQKETQPINRL